MVYPIINAIFFLCGRCMIFLLSLVHYQEDNDWIRSQELMLCKEKTASRIGTYSATQLGVTLILEADALDGLILPWDAKFAQPNGSSRLWEIAGCKVGHHATPRCCKIPLHEVIICFEVAHGVGWVPMH